MDNANLNPNEGIEEFVTPQEEQTTEQPVNAGSEEVAPSPVEKPVQDAETNHAYAEMRRARESAEAKAQQLEKDYQIAKTYGSEYGVYSEKDIQAQYGHQGINTFDDFKQAVERQKYIDQGIDPSLLDEYVNNNPTVKWANEFKKQQEDNLRLQSDYNDFLSQYPDIKPEEIPQVVWDQVAKGIPLRVAYAATEENTRLKAELEQFKKGTSTLKANEVNAESTPGSLTGNGSSNDLPLTPELINLMSESELSRRWKEVKQVLKMR